MPLASVIAHSLNGWGPPAPPPPASADVGGGSSSSRPRYTPKPIKNARHRQYSTLYATADAECRKVAELGGFVAAFASSATDVVASRGAVGDAGADVVAAPWFRRSVSADAHILLEPHAVARSGLPESERAARRRFVDSQLLMIIDGDSHEIV